MCWLGKDKGSREQTGFAIKSLHDGATPVKNVGYISRPPHKMPGPVAGIISASPTAWFSSVLIPEFPLAPSCIMPTGHRLKPYWESSKYWRNDWKGNSLLSNRLKECSMQFFRELLWVPQDKWSKHHSFLELQYSFFSLAILLSPPCPETCGDSTKIPSSYIPCLPWLIPLCKADKTGSCCLLL